MSRQDPIVKEVREIRDQLAAKHHYNIDELCRFLREQEKSSGRHYITLPARHPENNEKRKPQ